MTSRKKTLADAAYLRWVADRARAAQEIAVEAAEASVDAAGGGGAEGVGEADLWPSPSPLTPGMPTGPLPAFRRGADAEETRRLNPELAWIVDELRAAYGDGVIVTAHKKEEAPAWAPLDDGQYLEAVD
jgi:hypothetical protein